MVERNYELRTLCADDIFPMAKIISKIGIDDIANCFDAKEMSEVMEAMKPAEDEESEDEESEVGTAEKANELLTQQIWNEGTGDCEVTTWNIYTDDHRHFQKRRVR